MTEPIFEVVFNKKFLVQEAPKMGGPTETTIFWGTKNVCEELKRKFNNLLLQYEGFNAEWEEIDGSKK